MDDKHKKPDWNPATLSNFYYWRVRSGYRPTDQLIKILIQLVGYETVLEVGQSYWLNSDFGDWVCVDITSLSTEEQMADSFSHVVTLRKF